MLAQRTSLFKSPGTAAARTAAKVAADAAQHALGAVVPDEKRTAVPALAWWGEAYGSWRNQDGDGNAEGIDRNIGGLVYRY
ncbi:hypothetical protein [Mesorhizobium temperatum]|uniref:Uncharacterized protein n=1 Tax=Mesorhizobium temperatum TaxID=241416 RepID=A0A271LHU4_9HYPH|nr:hypothetical protein [Mesorhizobium temperatum]PAQ07654.1 hypothetical protein CIT26_20240 [Mesorhizobium temperatum]